MKMCEKILLYEHQELPLDQMQAMRTHIQSCQACQQELNLLNRLDQALVAPAVPADLIDKVFAKTTRKKSWFSQWKKVLAGAAAVVISVVLWVDLAHVPQRSFNAQEIVAYMNESVTDDYQSFEDELSEMENYFFN